MAEVIKNGNNDGEEQFVDNTWFEESEMRMDLGCTHCKK